MNKKYLLTAGVWLTLGAFTPMPLMAAESTESAQHELGELTLIYQDLNQELLSDVEVEIYQIASADEEHSLTIRPDFEAASINTTVLQDLDMFRDAEAVLSEYVRSHQIQPMRQGIRTDKEGRIVISGLDDGLYLILANGVEVHEYSPFLVALPYSTGDGWEYKVEAFPKVTTPEVPTQPEEFEVIEEDKNVEAGDIARYGFSGLPFVLAGALLVLYMRSRSSAQTEDRK